MLGLCRIADRDWPAAQLAFTTALRALDEIDDRATAVAALACLGTILTELGQPRVAASVLHEAVVRAQIIGYEFGELQCAWAVAFLAARSGRIDDAVRMDEALADRLTAMERGIPAVLVADYTASMEEARKASRCGPSQPRHSGSEWLRARALELAYEIASSPFVPLLAAVPAPQLPRRSRQQPGPAQQGTSIAFRSPLTNRELEILSAIAGGQTNAQIASSLVLSAKTVMHHTTSIYRKLGVRGRAGAVDFAHRSGMLRPPGS
jgi:DNA-binding CsgD family transcriptional regulator